MTRSRSEHGFTLVELTMVILIIGLLSTLAIPRFIGQRDEANRVKGAKIGENAFKAASAEMLNINTDFFPQSTASFFGSSPIDNERLNEIEPTVPATGLDPAVPLNSQPVNSGRIYMYMADGSGIPAARYVLMAACTVVTGPRWVCTLTWQLASDSPALSNPGTGADGTTTAGQFFNAVNNKSYRISTKRNVSVNDLATAGWTPALWDFGPGCAAVIRNYYGVSSCRFGTEN